MPERTPKTLEELNDEEFRLRLEIIRQQTAGPWRTFCLARAQAHKDYQEQVAKAEREYRRAIDRADGQWWAKVSVAEKELQARIRPAWSKFRG